jgi:hypothetical protein
MEVILNGHTIDFDPKLPYADFYLMDGKPQYAIVHWERILAQLQARTPTEDDINYLRMYSRWVNEAPRKRHYRDLIRSGIKVASTECFFEEDDCTIGLSGALFIDGLENTGKLAVQVLEAFGLKGVPPIKQDDPLRPTSVNEVLGEPYEYN